MVKQTILYSQHAAQKAFFCEFAAWQMPLHYGSQLTEHQTVRQQAGIFDVSHMLAIDISGSESLAYLRNLLANDPAKLNVVGKAFYTCILNEQGGIKDDLIVYRLAQNAYRCVVNAATRLSDLAWFEQQAAHFDVRIQPQLTSAILAIQGPQSSQYLKKIPMLNGFDLNSLKNFHGKFLDDLWIARTGYTGEMGVEIILPQQKAQAFWQQALSCGMQPIGLAARDTLRLEAGLNLYGQDMDETVTPFESNVGWTVDLNDETRDFIGKKALLELEPRYKLVGMVLPPKAIARAKMQVYDHSSHPIGVVTSGIYSPSLECGIALARIDVNFSSSDLIVEIRHKKRGANLVALPFVKQGQATFKIN